MSQKTEESVGDVFGRHSKIAASQAEKLEKAANDLIKEIRPLFSMKVGITLFSLSPLHLGIKRSTGIGMRADGHKLVGSTAIEESMIRDLRDCILEYNRIVSNALGNARMSAEAKHNHAEANSTMSAIQNDSMMHINDFIKLFDGAKLALAEAASNPLSHDKIAYPVTLVTHYMKVVIRDLPAHLDSIIRYVQFERK